MSAYIVYLYKEGEPMDGDDFACGPYADEDTATFEAEMLRRFGAVRVLPLYISSGAIAGTLADVVNAENET